MPERKKGVPSKALLRDIAARIPTVLETSNALTLPKRDKDNNYYLGLIEAEARSLGIEIDPEEQQHFQSLHIPIDRLRLPNEPFRRVEVTRRHQLAFDFLRKSKNPYNKEAIILVDALLAQQLLGIQLATGNLLVESDKGPKSGVFKVGGATQPYEENGQIQWRMLVPANDALQVDNLFFIMLQ